MLIFVSDVLKMYQSRVFCEPKIQKAPLIATKKSKMHNVCGFYARYMLYACLMQLLWLRFNMFEARVSSHLFAPQVNVHVCNFMLEMSEI